MVTVSATQQRSLAKWSLVAHSSTGALLQSLQFCFLLFSRVFHFIINVYWDQGWGFYCVINYCVIHTHVYFLLIGTNLVFHSLHFLYFNKNPKPMPDFGVFL